jgi:pimeloyl-ACP methyl ester carboxylesterase
MTALGSEWHHQFVETNQIRLHCVSQGEGDLVLLLHGFPEFWYSWRFQIPALARYFKVVVPDLRGYNDSDKPDSGYDLDTLSADIYGLIEGLGYRHAHIIGHDWGGMIAWYIAQKFPKYLNRLAVLNAVPLQCFLQEMVSNLDQLQRSWYVFAFQVPGISEWWIQQNLKEFVKQVFQGQAIRKGAFSKEETQLYQQALEKPGVLSATLSYYRNVLSPWPWLRNWGNVLNPVTAPTLVLWGEEDTLLNHHMTERLEQMVKAPFQLKLIPHCGHWVQQEAPQTVNRELLAFLRS